MTKMTTKGAGQERIQELIRPPEDVMSNKIRNTTGTMSASGSKTGMGPFPADIMSFPSDLGRHHMVLQFYRYEFENDSFQRRVVDNTISLPIPLQLVEAINVSYAESNLGAFRGAISDLIAGGDIKGAADAGLGVVTSVYDAGKVAGNIVTGTSGFAEAFASQKSVLDQASLLARGGTGFIGAGLNRFFGSAPNPHITALFQGVSLRTHQFNWKLAPSSLQETETLSAIINKFRAAMLPGRSSSNLTLQFPDEVEIYLMGSQSKHMYHFKTAVIKTMSTNFAPDGQLSFFGKNGAPTAVTLDLQLQETVIHYREDYDGSSVEMSAGNNQERSGEDMVTGQNVNTVNTINRSGEDFIRGGNN